jgi:RHS repeat-associated protein
LANHLGNVLVTVSDRKIQTDNNSDGLVDYYTADVASAQDFYPFGSKMASRQWNNGSYRYGFNGKENDNEVKGEGNQQDYGMRIYDPRIGKFLSVDPLTKGYPELTPYQFASNTPIAAIDIDGEESGIPMNGIGPSGTPLSNYFDNAEGRKTWFKALGTGIVIGGAVLVDIYVTKGRLTQTLLMSQGLGLLEHNRGKTSEQRAAQDSRFKENATDFFINLSGGIVIGRFLRGSSVLLSDTRKLYNFGSKALGEMGEEAMNRYYGTVKPKGKGSSLSTSEGPRKPDGIPEGTTVQSTDKLFEAKVGFKEYAGDIVDQVAKDAELITSKQVNEITWVFWRSPNTGKVGASDELLKELKNAGIKTEIAGYIPKDIVDKHVIKYAPTVKQ